jgi:glycosyltransferase involved in cell wall biosynthesis
MVIVKLYGGLGNQLFQYATARALAIRNDAMLKLDASSGFERDFYKRRYSLNCFNIPENFASPEEIAASAYIREKHFHFDPEVCSLRGDVYLDGYWQSEKYFKSIEEIIREELSIRRPLEGVSRRIADEMAATNSVCIHFRRLHGISGSQVDVHGVNIHGAASLDYYYRCIEHLTQTVRDPYFFVFSDDPGWARDHLKLPYPTLLVTHNGPDKDYEDLRLMSLCKHHIIANSTFSWWGAWLNPARDKMVFVPEQWFNAAEHNTKDLIPESWVKVSVPKPPAADLSTYGRYISRELYQEAQSNFNEASAGSMKISVIIPCYDQARYLPDAVQSIVNQTYTTWECIIINDGSSDNTAEVAHQLIAQYPERRIRFIDKPHSGVSDTRNVGVEVATGEWILPLDSDDMFEPSFMQRAIEIIEREPKVDVVFSNMQEFGASSGQWIPDEYSRAQVMVSDTMPYASLYRRDLWHKVGGYDRLLSIIRQPEDWSFWISCSKHNVTVRRIHEKLFLYRVHPQSTYLTKIKPNRRLAWAFVATCHPDLYPPRALVEAWSLISECPDDIYDRIVKAVEKCPEHGLACFWRALANRGRGRTDEAMADCQTAVQKARKNDWQSALLLTRWRRDGGDLATAFESLDKLLRIRPDFGWARDLLPSAGPQRAEVVRRISSGTQKILFYFDRIGNLNETSPAGTVIAVLNLARMLKASRPDVEIDITGDLVSHPEQHEFFRMLPFPSADGKQAFLAEYNIVFFATHIRWFRNVPKRPGQIWIVHQHCWDIDDQSKDRIEDVDAVICLSQLHRAFLETRSIDAEKFVTIPNLIDTDVYFPQNVSCNNHSIMFAGGLHPHKCLHILLDAFERLRGQIPDAELHLYGDGAMWRGGNDYGDYLKSIKPKGVYFHGYIDHADMPGVYSRHGILCLPSMLESFGLVTVEAQACGCIPVVHKVGGVAATLADGRTGLLYEPNTPQKLAETIIQAIRMVDADPSMRQRAVNFARDNFSMTNAAKYISRLEDRIAAVRQKSASKEWPRVSPGPQPLVNHRRVERPQNAGAGPLVSVIMPVYNGADYIGRAIESVLTQDYRNFELIVIDDGSTDATGQVVQSSNDERIRYFRQDNSGVSSARNSGIRRAAGRYIMPLDADDMMAPAFITKHLREFEEYPDADLVYCDVLLIDENGNPLNVMKKPEYKDRRHLIRDLFRAGHPIVPFRLGIRRSVFEKIGFYDESLLVGEDYDMMRRFVKAGLKPHHLGEALHLRRVQPNSLTRNYSAQKAKCHFEVVKRFSDTFTHEELFPDVRWNEMPAETRLLHAHCLAVVTYLGIGQDFIKSNSPSVYVKMAFEAACSQLNDCLKIDPDNWKIRQLLQKCERGREWHGQGIPQVVGRAH